MKAEKWKLFFPLLILCAMLVQTPPARAGGPGEVTMRVGEERTIYAPITTAGTNNGYWTSNSPAVSVSGSGYSCTARAKSVTGGITAILTHHYTEKLSSGMTVSRIQDVRVTVLPPLPTGASVSPRSMTLMVGEGRYLTPTVSPAGADYGSWIYSSADASVAEVSNDGRVQGVSPGTTEIRVRTRNEGKSACCEVTVVPQTCEILFDAAGGTVNPSGAVIEVGEPYGTLPVPERAGYIFDGWFTAAGGGNRIMALDTVKYAGKQTLYAHWMEKDAVPPAVLGWTSGESSAVILSDPDGTLKECKTVFAAAFSGERLEELAPGKLLGDAVTVNRKLAAGWTLYFLDENGAPVCPAVVIPQA